MTQTAPTAQPHIIDLDTAEGATEWVRQLPTANLREIAARPVFVCEAGSNLLIVCAAQGELIVRGGAEAITDELDAGPHPDRRTGDDEVVYAVESEDEWL